MLAVRRAGLSMELLQVVSITYTVIQMFIITDSLALL